MKLMFHKKELYGGWFVDDADNDEFTEKAPQHTNQIFDEGLGEWTDKPAEPESEGE